MPAPEIPVKLCISLRIWRRIKQWISLGCVSDWVQLVSVVSFDAPSISHYTGEDYIILSSKHFTKDTEGLMCALLWPCRVFIGAKGVFHFKAINFNCMR